MSHRPGGRTLAMARRPIARVRDDRLCPLDAEGRALPEVIIGSDAWLAWLEGEGHASFAYASVAGTFTARCEHRHGRSYWYAYRTVDGRLRKEYLGASERLTPERLAEVAGSL